MHYSIRISILTLALVACGERGPAKSDVADSPAVIQTPRPLIPSDTAKPDTTARLAERAEEARLMMGRSYAFIAAMIAFNDSSTMSKFYLPDASLSAPGVKAEGPGRIASAMIRWGKSISLRDMQRVPSKIVFLKDSIAIDSGTYVVVTQREGQAPSARRGTYATTWRMQSAGNDWLVVKDNLAEASVPVPMPKPTVPLQGAKAPARSVANVQGLGSPSAAALAAPGPDSFDLAVFTTKGRFTARLRRAWSPKGADRVFHATSARYYDGVRFYRVIPGFMAQFGFHGDPKVTAAWEQFPLKDEPAKMSNTRGMLTFANRGPNTRTVQLFVNTANNGPSLDPRGFNPIGSVTEGMSVVDALYSGYGEGAPRGPGPDQGQITTNGNAYLSKSFPKLDGIDSARIIRRWP